MLVSSVLIKQILFKINLFVDKLFFDFLMGIGDWGLGIGPNPQSPIYIIDTFKLILIFNFNKLFIIKSLLKNQKNNL
jgi:hypothetical protein